MLKCNIKSVWLKSKSRTGGAWVLRDFKGKVILHSRRSFSGIQTKDDSKLKILIWAFESVHQHDLDKVVFSSQDKDFLEALLRPKAWPSFKLQVAKILKSLGKFSDWRIEVKSPVTNRSTFLIAQCALSYSFTQSYVASKLLS